MRKQILLVIAIMLLLTGMAEVSEAALTTIGTVTYEGSDYNLIWDDNNNGNSVVWLDYSNAPDSWPTQNAWAAGLASVLTNISTPGYTVTWDDDAWRLPGTVDGHHEFGLDGNTTAGYNITSSEMGHLFYEELGNLGFSAADGTAPQSGWGLNNTGDFNYLSAPWYWSATDYAELPINAWAFRMVSGLQSLRDKDDAVPGFTASAGIGIAPIDINLDLSIENIAYINHDYYGLAVRSGQVSAVPVPGAVWLLASGLAGLGALRRAGSGHPS